MIDSLHNVVSHLEYLPPEAQEEAATYIAVLAEVLERKFFVLNRIHAVPSQIKPEQPWEDPAGAWRDLPDTLLEDLDQLRHASSPTQPLDDNCHVFNE
jgi:hypothetical protein